MDLKPDRSDEEVIAAVRRGDVGELRRILACDASKANARDRSGVSALLLGVYENHDDTVRLLLEHRRDVDVFEAAAIGLTDAVEQIPRQDRDAVHDWSRDGFTPLHLAEAGHDFARVEGNGNSRRL
jgi:ankyrin repeat protein